MAELALVVVLGAFFVAFGRSGVADGTPLRNLSAHQLGVALLEGIVTFHRLHEQRRDARSTGRGARRRGRPLGDTAYDPPLGAAARAARGAGRPAARPWDPCR
jgi:hypothetical protein